MNDGSLDDWLGYAEVGPVVLQDVGVNTQKTSRSSIAAAHFGSPQQSRALQLRPDTWCHESHISILAERINRSSALKFQVPLRVRQSERRFNKSQLGVGHLPLAKLVKELVLLGLHLAPDKRSHAIHVVLRGL